MLSKVRPCHSVNVLTFPGCDRSVLGGDGNGTDLRAVCRVCMFVRGEGEVMCVNVCDLPTMPRVLSLMHARTVSRELQHAGLLHSREGALKCRNSPSAAECCLT